MNPENCSGRGSTRRRMGILAASAAVVAGLATAPIAPAVDGGARAVSAPHPLFHLPFPCGETWRAYTHTGHAYPDAQLDFGQGSPPDGRQVVAARAGTVAENGVYGDGSSYLVLDHGDGWSTRYVHMRTASMARTGSVVRSGDPIGEVGDVGSAGQFHLHFEQRHDGVPVPIRFDDEPVTYKYFPEYVTLVSGNCGGEPSEPEPVAPPEPAPQPPAPEPVAPPRPADDQVQDARPPAPAAPLPAHRPTSAPEPDVPSGAGAGGDTAPPAAPARPALDHLLGQRDAYRFTPTMPEFARPWEGTEG
ncbi:murein hydrolase activator EnvC family protein [Actinoalloteichus spitiensis]|uniref:murein hydrolase activator EnvC family protein n=1 Tax=Actinoalloteichus spitiensis TaxID=252394 RepID=UPI000A2F7A32|nr:M23 family metallopeptidase [Actinoalloteichus spitiensis]